MEFSPLELAKLPKWAAQKVQNLEGMLARVEKRLDIATGTTKTSIYQRVLYGPEAKSVYLNPLYEIVFEQDENHRAIEVYQGSDNDLKYYGPHIRLLGVTGGLKISPECSNVIRIALEKL